jgi:transcriptional regulator with XRE-family HTH domain
MNLIGENIKRLRKQNHITQEALANYLSLSCQAISKWERGESSPDVSYLCALAVFFRVSTDELLGMTETVRENRVLSYLEQCTALENEGKTEELRALIELAFAEFPTDYRLMMRYIDCLLNDPEVEDVYEAHRMELSRLCRSILDGCSDESLRFRAIDLLSLLCYQDGKEDEAVAMLSVFPSAYQTANQRLASLYDEGTPERLLYSRRNMMELLEASALQARQIVSEDGTLSIDEQIDLLSAAIGSIKIYFVANDFGYLHYHLSDLYVRMANRYMMTGEPRNVFECLDLALEHAAAFDALPDRMEHTSPCVTGCVFDRDARAFGREHKLESQLDYLRTTCRELYAPLWESDEMQTLLAKR